MTDDDFCTACGMALSPARRQGVDWCLSCRRPLDEVTP